jgi:hypothetical protein
MQVLLWKHVFGWCMRESERPLQMCDDFVDFMQFYIVIWYVKEMCRLHHEIYVKNTITFPQQL